MKCGRPKFDSWIGKIPWRKEWLPTPIFLPGKSHGQRNLAGYSPWGNKELDTTERLSLRKVTEYRINMPKINNFFSVFTISTQELKVKVKLLSCIRFSVTPQTVACQVPLSMGFSRQEYWSGLLFPSPGDLPNPAIKPGSPVSPALAGRFFTTEPPGKSLYKCRIQRQNQVFTYVST